MVSYSKMTKAQLVEELAKAHDRIALLEERQTDAVGHKSGREPPSDPLSREFLESVLNVLSTPVFIKDTDGVFLGCNTAFETFFGAPCSEIRGKTVYEITSKELAEIYTDKDHRLLEVGGVQIYDSKVSTRERGLRDVLFTKYLIHDADGAVLAIVGEVSDITEKKRVEAEYRESREQYKRLSAATFEAIFMSDMGVCVGQNETARKMFGYSDAEAEGRMGTEWIHPDDRELVFTNMRRESVEPYEVRALRKDGTVFPCEIQARMVREGDRPIRLTALRDITERKKAEQALLESEARYRAYVDNAPLGIFVADEDGRYVDVNRCACEMLGYERDELLAMDIPSLNAPEGNDEPRRFHELKQKGYLRTERKLRHKNGKSVYVSLNAVSLGDGRYMGFCKDISRRRKELEVLRKSETMFRTVFEHSPVGIALVAPDFMLMQANQAYCDFLGYTEEELSRMGIAEFTHPDDVEENIRLQTLLKDGEIPEYQMIKRFIRKDKEVVYGLLVAASVRDSEGKLLFFIGQVMDISEQVWSREQLQQAMERLAFHVDNSPLGVIEWKEGRTIESWSSRAEEIFGWSADEVIGKNWREFPFVHPDDEGSVVRNIQRLVSGTRNFVTSRNRNLHKDGSVVYCQWYNSVLQDDEGRVLSILSQVADVSELKHTSAQLIEAKEQAEAADKAKSRFLANMSHEIRTPLNGIIGMLQLLALTDINAEQKEYVLTAVESSRRLNRLISDILDLSRVEADRLMLVDEDFDFRGVMELSRNLFEPDAERKGLELHFRMAPSIPARLNGDEVRLRQVLNNLVGNALKFTEEGWITVEAGLVSKNNDHCRILFSVSDTGIGISDNRINEMFNAFTQGEEHFTRRYQGAGLGLSITKRLVDLMGGNMSVAGTQGEGTTFYFSIPFKYANGACPDESVKQSDEDRTLSGLRVLLAEDEPDCLFLLERMLTREGCSVDTAGNGAEVLEKIKVNSYDALITDIQMPTMDGRALINAVRTYPEYRHAANIPIVVVTACAMPSDRERIKAADVDEYLFKPVDIREFKEALCKAVKGRQDS